MPRPISDFFHIPPHQNNCLEGPHLNKKNTYCTKKVTVLKFRFVTFHIIYRKKPESQKAAFSQLKSSPWAKYTLYATIFPKKSSSTIKLFFFFKYVIYQTVLSKYLKKKIGCHRARLREKENLFTYRAKFEGNHLHFVRAHAYVRALMTRKSCAVEMRNAMLRNYLQLFSNVSDVCYNSRSKNWPKYDLSA